MRVSYPWMGGHSGYDCLVDQLQTANHAHAFHSFHKPQQQLGYLSRRLISRAYHRSRGSEFYSREHAHAERSMMRWAKHNSCDLAFYCHADEGFGLAGTRPIPGNPALTARQGAAARQRAVTRLDWSLIAAQTMTVLTEAAQAAPSGS